MTDVKRRLREVVQMLRSSANGRALWSCLLAISLSVIILLISKQMKAVYIRDGEITTLKYTLSHEPQKILNDSGIVTMACDIVDFSGFEGKMGVINITRAFPVTIQVDGKLSALMTTDSTVGQLLRQQGITLGEFDEINISPVLYLSPNDQIVIKRVQLTTTIVHETIPYEVEYKENSLIRRGGTRTLISGQNGERAITYIDRVVDGVLHAREQREVIVTRQPVTQLVLRGTSEAVSDLDFGIPLNANGAPVRYKQLLTDQICTGYSAGRSAYGASRMTLQDGYVAVRAHEIPYGTKMYITSPDNSFVYGFAIAADTGIGLMQNVIDFDLYYETYVESCLNGRKQLNVYILE
ncbi:MAG TPA: G5 domain-containing protein [Clostridia bacterium]|nr:G5 domain-containing protein [Clostridia bacterium]